MFVLGYRAKKMRQTKLADLIHISEGMAELDSCTVEVHFIRIIDGECDNYQAIPSSRIVVQRTAYRNNRNVYMINGVTSNYNQINTLLKAQGIDLDHKRFLILQGEVEAIAMMKPKGSTEHEEGLLEYLEDIIGTNSYISAIDEAAKTLDAIVTVHSEKFLRVRAAEKECNGLREEKEEAEAYLRQENIKIERQNELLQANIWKAKTETVLINARLEEKRLQLETERSKNAQEAADADELEGLMKAACQETAELEKLTKKLQAELSQLEQNDVKMQETRKHLKTKLKNLSKQSSDSTKQEAEIGRNLEDMAINIATIKEDLEVKRRELETAQGELDKISASLKGVTHKHQKELDSKQAELAPLQNDLRQAQQELGAAEASLTLLEEKSSAGHKEQAELQEKLKLSEEELGKAQKKRNLLEVQHKELGKKLAEGKTKVKELENMRNNSLRNLQMFQNTVAEAMSTFNQSETGSTVHKLLMKESKAGKIKGIHGRLGDLGAIDPKYDVAIATACSYLDHVVVDTTEVGQQCIEQLRRTNAGRANFIILDKMRPAIKEPPRDLPKEALRLFDLVKLKDSRYIDAMYFALHDTLVASTLEQAQAWAYGAKRWRVVTLDGKLFETSGTISGGGQARRGGMGNKVSSSNDISEEQVKMLQEKCREAQEELKQIVSTISKDNALLHDWEDQLIRTEAELSIVNGSIKALSAEMAIIQENLVKLKAQNRDGEDKEVEKERKTINKLIAKHQSQVESIEQRMKPIQDAIAQIQQKILDAGGIKYKVQRSKVDGLVEQIQNDEKRLLALDKEKITLERRLIAIKSGQKDDVAITKVEAELAQLDKQLQVATEAAVSLHQEFNSLQTNLDERNEQVGRLKEKLDEVSKSVNRFRKVEYELRSSIENDEKKMADLARTIETSLAELKQLKLNHIDPREPVPVLPIWEEDEEELAEFYRSAAQIKQTIQGITLKLERLRPNLKVLEEYRQKEAVLSALQEELAQMETNKDEARHRFEELSRRRLDEFMAGFRTISARLKEMYQLITMGGNAELELVDSLDPFSEGVLFSVMPPRKSWKNISNLSGGEKTLSSLALVFALHTYRPTPIYIMDEIDAALDFRNVSIVAHYIKERTKDAQFIVISLRNNMFELADRLVGIYKTCQRTKSVAIDPHRFNLVSNQH